MSPTGAPTNEDLLTRYAKADKGAFEQFYRRNHRLIFHFLIVRLTNVSDAEEALQETFLRLHKAIDRYDPSKSALTWTLTIARNVAIDRLRRKKEVLLGDQLDSVGIESDHAVIHEAKEVLRADVARLPADERRLLEARFFDDQSFNDIATDFGITAASARQRLGRLLQRLKSDFSR
jgi:RNA polymerase sigma factor (sigma-70 family)